MKNERDLEKKQKQINRYSTFAILLVIVLLAGITYFIVQKDMKDFSRDALVELHEEVPVLKLHIVRQADKVEFEPGATSLSIGEAVYFEVSTQRPFHTALVYQISGRQPVAAFVGAKIPPGPRRLFEKEDVVYVYKVEQKPVRFCLVYDTTAALLKKQLEQMDELWSSFGDARCVTVE